MNLQKRFTLAKFDPWFLSQNGHKMTRIPRSWPTCQTLGCQHALEQGPSDPAFRTDQSAEVQKGNSRYMHQMAPPHDLKSIPGERGLQLGKGISVSYEIRGERTESEQRLGQQIAQGDDWILRIIERHKH